MHSESKDGKDAGTLAGIDPLGVAATRDDAAILAGDADCIIYTGPATSRPREAITDFCRILKAGKNIVTTSVPGLVYPRGSIKPSTVQRIIDSAIKGGSSIYSSGIEPGFGCDLLAIAMASMSNRIYSIRGLEITDYSRDNTVYEMRESSSASASRWTIRAHHSARVSRTLGRGDHHGRRIARRTTGRDSRNLRVRPAPRRRLETLSGVIEPGTVAAVWFRCIGVVDGQEVITIEHVDRMADDVAPDWPKSRAGGIDGVWRVIIEGEPFRRRVRNRLQRQ